MNFLPDLATLKAKVRLLLTRLHKPPSSSTSPPRTPSAAPRTPSRKTSRCRPPSTKGIILPVPRTFWSRFPPDSSPCLFLNLECCPSTLKFSMNPSLVGPFPSDPQKATKFGTCQNTPTMLVFLTNRCWSTSTLATLAPSWSSCTSYATR